MANPKPWEFIEIDDENGVPTVHVREEHLSDFPKFMHFIIKDEIGMSEGVFKVKLAGPWESQSKLDDLLNFAHKYFTTKVHTGRGKKMKAPHLQVQRFYYGMTDEHLYGFRDKPHEMTASERRVGEEFINTLKSPSSFSSDQCTCCSDSLLVSKENLVGHYWSIIRNNSSPSCGILEKKDCQALTESEVNAARMKYHISNEDCEAPTAVNKLPSDSKPSCEPILYGSVPVVGVDFAITKTFSLSKLGTVIDIYKEVVPGVSYPFLYVGRKHAAFPWHVEDVCAFSINFLHFGAPCVWFFVPPKYYNEFVVWSHHMPLDLGQTSCNNVLGHKYLLASEDFLNKLGIPVLTVVQREKEIVITYPYGAHSGFKTGFSISQAANFGDPWWVDLAILAPTCECFKLQLRMNLSHIIQVCRPQLLDLYNSQDMLGLFHALQGNKFIKELGIMPPKIVMKASLRKEPVGDSGHQDNIVGENVEDQNKLQEYKFKGSRGLLECPACDKTFTGGRAKFYRLENHIKAAHNGDPAVLKKATVMNPPKLPGKTGSNCTVCGEWRSGNKFHMEIHMKRKHPGEKQ